jgi:hypothetical protein
MADDHEIRLRILEAVLPQATRVGLEEPDQIVKVCTRLEKYVLDSAQIGEKLSDSPTKRPPGRPSIKGTTSHEMNGNLGPATGG